MSTSADMVSDILSQVNYRHPELTKQQVVALLQQFRGLAPRKDKFTFNDGQERDLINIQGTIKVPYRGQNYNIPVSLNLLDTHPYHAPLCFVKPTSDMLVKESKNVDSAGKIYLPYLHEWSHPASDLLGLVTMAIVTFSEQMPVYAKPKPPPLSDPGPHPKLPYPPGPPPNTAHPKPPPGPPQASGYPANNVKCKVSNCDWQSSIEVGIKESHAVLKEHYTLKHPGEKPPLQDQIHDGMAEWKIASKPFKCHLSQAWVITKDKENYMYMMPESKLPLDRWTRTMHDQMTDFLDQKLTEGCAGSVMKMKDKENQWKVNFQSCTINLATNNPNDGFGGQIRPEARPQFQEDVEEIIEKMRLAGIDSPSETISCDAVRRHCDTGEFSVLPTGAKSVRSGWKIITKGKLPGDQEGPGDGAVLELGLFLGRCGLEQLGTVLAREGVTLADLLEMEGNDEEMKKVGVKAYKDRKQLESAIREHKAGSDATSEGAVSAGGGLE